MTMLFHTAGVFIGGLNHQLGRTRRNLNELKAAGLLSNNVAEIAKLGYEYNFGTAADESLLSLAAAPLSYLLEQCRNPQALIFHHSYPESASFRREVSTEAGFMSHAQYFPAALMRELNLDDIPYLGSFATGCTGLLSLIMTASGFCAFSHPGPLICLTADIKPSGTTYDALREKILTSDCASGFIISHERCSYQVLGIAYYSTKRMLVSLVEIVKRTVQMVRELTSALAINWAQSEVVLHYPNIFPGAWDMVSNYLQVPRESHVLDGLSDRAHCLSSDSIISLAKFHRGEAGRLHVVVNYGSGLHLGVGIFREEECHGPTA